MIVGTYRASSTVSAGRRNEEAGLSAGEQGDGDDEEVVIIDLGGKRKKEQEPRAREKLIGWAYVGSHNFTPSAWGTLSGSAANPSLNVRPIHSALA